MTHQQTAIEETQRLRAIVDCCDQAVIECDSGGVVKAINPAGCALLALPESEVVDRPVTEFLALSSAQRLKGLGRDEPLDHEISLESRFGGVFFHLSPALYNGSDGRFVLVSKLHTQTPDFTHAEDQALVMRVHSSLDGRIMRVTRRLCDWMGYEEHELVGKSFTSVVVPEEAEIAMARFRDLRSGKIATYETEKRYLTKDGRIIWGYVNAVLVRDQVGVPLFVLIYLHDISEQKHAQHSLLTSELRERARAEELAALLETLPIAVCIAYDPECRQLVGNRAIYQLLGVAEGENLAAALCSRADGVTYGWSPDDFPLRLAIEHRMRIESGELEIRGAGQSIRRVTAVAAPLFNAEQVARGGVCVLVDVTDRVAHEKELERTNEVLQRVNEELRDFAYVVAHDLKTPLRAVATLASLIEEDVGSILKQKHLDHLSLLRSRVARMDRLIEGILAFAGLGNETFAVTEQVNVSDVLRDVVADVSSSGFRIILEESYPTLQASRHHIEQIFQNLVGNAIKHHDERVGTITIKSRKREGFWRFCIADDGPGIPSEHREMVFKMFQTLNNRTRDDEKSTGLGLAMVKKIVVNYGGGIWVSSNQPRGTVIEFTFPL